MYLGLARAHFLNDNGQCKPFDEAADGYSRAEGCGVVVLKHLSQALNEGDRILGVIRSIGVNQCGDAKSITHPDHATQSALFRTLFSRSGVSPRWIGVIEAHGTGRPCQKFPSKDNPWIKGTAESNSRVVLGTQAGDLAETRSLQSVFEDSRHASRPLYLSSVKGNIGHAEAASGMAGLAKLILMMKNKQVLPQASLHKLNPHLGLSPGGNMVVPTRLCQWSVATNSTRLALLNNFGAAGSNAALIIEEPPDNQPSRPLQSPQRSCHILNISARTRAALEHLKSEFVTLIGSGELDISSLCYTANSRRMEHDAYRLSAIGKTQVELVAQLRKTVTQAQTGSTETRRSRTKVKAETVFVFSGQGSIYGGMGAELLSTEPQFNGIVRACDRILSSSGYPEVFPYMASSDPSYSKGLEINQRTIVEQCSCFVLEYALARMWITWGVIPDLVIGHR